MKMTIAKLLSGFCWVDVRLQPAAGEEAGQQGKGFCLCWTRCPLPRAVSHGWLCCLAHSLKLCPRAASSHKGGFRQRQELEMRRWGGEGREEEEVVVAIDGNP